MSTLQNSWQYFTECLRLIYWSFFKPFTFNHWLRQEIDPRLTFIDSLFFIYRREFARNPKLQRYADQVIWTTIFAPWLVTVFVASCYVLISGEEFVWSRSIQFLCGWSIGVLLGTITTTKKIGMRLVLLFSFFIGTLVIIHHPMVVVNVVFCVVFGMVFGVVLGVAFGVALGVTFGIAFGVMGDVALGAALSAAGGGVVVSVERGVMLGAMLGMVFGITVGVVVNVTGSVAGGVALGAAVGVVFGTVFDLVLGVVEGVAFGIAFGVAGGTVFGVAFGLTEGVVFGVVEGVAFGVTLTIFCLLGLFRLYSWPFEALWTLGLRFRYLPSQADQALRWLPPYFDEVIHLPLPFMTSLIIEAYRINPAAARQTLDHLTHFTNQKRVVEKASVRIVLETIQVCQTEADLAFLATDKLEWIPSPPPKSLGTMLPKCLDISRDVRNAYEATTAHRHQQSLRKPLKTLKELKQQVVLEKNLMIRTTLGPVVQNWLGILETAQKNLVSQIRQTGELPNTYIAEAPLSPEEARENFQGRQAIFAEIETLSLMRQTPTLLLYGYRRIGKTSVLKYLPKRTGADLVPLLVTVQEIAEANTLVGVAEGMARQIFHAARTTRHITFPDYDVEALRQDPFPALRRWFNHIERRFAEKRFLLCLDEFECLEEVVRTTNSRALLNFLRATVEYYPRWIVLFAGAHHPRELAKYWSDYLINTQTVHLSYLQEQEARNLIEHPSTDFPAEVYDPEAINEIIAQTRCQPYLVQLLCQNIIELLNRDKRRRAHKDDVIAALDHAMNRGKEYFTELWNTTLGHNSDRVIIKKVMNKQAFTEEEQQRIPDLIDKEILETTETNGYRFQVPWVERFLRQYGERKNG